MTNLHGLVTLKFGGKNRPFKFGWHFLKLFSEQFNIELAGLPRALQHLTGTQLLAFIKIALEEGQRVSGGEEEFTVAEVADWLDDAGPEFFKGLMEKAQLGLASIGPPPAKAEEKN